MSNEPARQTWWTSQLCRSLLAGILTTWCASVGSAQFAIDGGSILLFPHIEASDDWDTMVQMVNTSVSPIYVECHYLDGGDTSPSTAFHLELLASQPTHWIASSGREVDPDDGVCTPLDMTPSVDRCNGAGFDPGTIPALANGFRGYLMCVQIDRSGAPESGNALAGAATLRSSLSADVAKYEAFPIAGRDDNDADRTLCLGGDPDAICPRGAEYDGCPDAWLLTLPVAGGSGGIVPEGSEARPSITVVPCGVDVRRPASEHTLQLIAHNEFQQSFSAAAEVVGWRHGELTDFAPLLNAQVVGSEIATLRIQTMLDSGPVIVLGQIEHRDLGSARVATSFLGAHPQDTTESTISIPVGPEAER